MPEDWPAADFPAQLPQENMLAAGDVLCALDPIKVGRRF
jgi:hypothetical protein